MRRAPLALSIGGAFVAGSEVLARLGIAAPIPSSLLIPGMVAGLFASDAGWMTEGPAYPWGPISTSITYVLNVAIYSALVFAIHVLSERQSGAQEHSDS